MKAHGDWDGTSPFVEVLSSFIERHLTTLKDERERFISEARKVETGAMTDVRVDLSDVAAMKLVADAVLLRGFGELARSRPAGARSDE